jgi:MFS family permease
MGSFLVFGIAEILMPSVSSFEWLIVIISILGLCDGLYLCVLMPIIIDVTGSSNLSNQATGYYHAAISIPVVIGPVLSGYIFEKTNSYDTAYYLGGITCIICAFILFLIPCHKAFKSSCVRKSNFKNNVVYDIDTNEKYPRVFF